MTVIATDGITIAADGLTTASDLRLLTPCRKIITRPELIFAASGAAGVLGQVADWYERGAHAFHMPYCHDSDGWDLLVIERVRGLARDLIWLCHSKAPYKIDVTPPFAIGAGKEAAMGAMLAGATAEQAVEIACKLHTSCGPPILAINIKDAFAFWEKPMEQQVAEVATAEANGKISNGWFPHGLKEAAG